MHGSLRHPRTRKPKSNCRSGGLIGGVEKNFRMFFTGSLVRLNFTNVEMIENFAVTLACQNESKVLIYSTSTRSLSVDSSLAECWP